MVRAEQQLAPQIIDDLVRSCDCDIRTVRKILRGEPVRGRVAFRIRHALKLLGYSVPEPAPNGGES